MILMYVTCKNEDEAKTIARALLEKQMTACVQIFPVSSMYWWEEKITEDNEAVLLIKTLKQNYDALSREIRKLHSYSVPFIAALKIHEINGDYYNYLKQNVVKYYGKKSPTAKHNRKIKRTSKQSD